MSLAQPGQFHTLELVHLPDTIRRCDQSSQIRESLNKALAIAGSWFQRSRRTNLLGRWQSSSTGRHPPHTKLHTCEAVTDIRVPQACQRSFHLESAAMTLLTAQWQPLHSVASWYQFLVFGPVFLPCCCVAATIHPRIAAADELL